MEGGATPSCVHIHEVTMQNQLHHLGISVANVDEVTETLVSVFGAERVPSPSAGHTMIRFAGIEVAIVPLRDGDPTTRAFGDHVAVAAPASARAEIERKLSERGWATEDVRGRLYARSPDGMLTLEILSEGRS